MSKQSAPPQAPICFRSMPRLLVKLHSGSAAIAAMLTMVFAATACDPGEPEAVAELQAQLPTDIDVELYDEWVAGLIAVFWSAAKNPQLRGVGSCRAQSPSTPSANPHHAKGLILRGLHL